MSFHHHKPTTILIIGDDEDDILFFIEAVKEVDNSIECIGSNNPLEVLTLLKKEDIHIPDYIFLDINMPCMNGKECLTEIKKIHTLFQTPVYFYTTSEREDLKELKQLGAAHYFTKPYRFHELLNLIKGVIYTG